MQNTNLISQYRTAVQQLLLACDNCRALELIMTAEGGATALFVGAGDFQGANADLTNALVAAAVTSRGAIEALCSANGNAHYTNLMKLRA